MDRHRVPELLPPPVQDNRQTDLPAKPPLFLLTVFWGPSCGVTDREWVQTLTVCWSPGWVWLGSGAQGKGKAPWPVVGKEVHAS